MKNKITLLSFVGVLFVFLLALAGAVDGVMGDVIYYLSFIVPFFMGFVVARPMKIEVSLPRVKLSFTNTALLLPTVFPVIGIVMLMSFLTSLLLSLVATPTIPDLSGNVVYLIFFHAVIPAVLEEALFRYLPMSIIGKDSPKILIFYSAFFFAFAHCDLFSIPYALIAGILFMLIDVMLDSVLPSVILHVINNLFAIISGKYFSAPSVSYIYYLSVALLAFVSIVVIAALRKRYVGLLSPVAGDKTPPVFSLSLAAFGAMCLIVAASSLVL